jgi:hypothetical protein
MSYDPELLAKEQRKEKSFNAVAEAIINEQPWGKFYGLMKGASDLGEGLLPHRVCLDKQGRILKVYKGKAGRWVGAFIRPAHEHAAKAFSQKKYGRGVLGLMGFGWIPNLIEQKKANCVEVVPEDFLSEADRRRSVIKNDPMRGPIQLQTTAKYTPQELQAQTQFFKDQMGVQVPGTYMGKVNPFSQKSQIGDSLTAAFNKVKPYQWLIVGTVVAIIVFLALKLKN